MNVARTASASAPSSELDRPSSTPRLPLSPARGLTRFAHVPRRVHLFGAGGAGVSGAARLLVEHGHEVSGHDRAESEHLELLRHLGVAVELDPSNARFAPQDAELIVRSAAIAIDDARLREAETRGVRSIKYAELLRLITPERRTIAVAGTHGKTTTSWLVYHALRTLAQSRGAGGKKPGALVGGICRLLEQNATSAEAGGWFSVEACEYDRSFLQLSPFGAVITNVEADHLDYYGDFDAIKGAFAHFADRIPPDGLLVIGRDVPRSVEDAARCTVWRYGRELKIDLVGERAGRFAFRVRGPNFEIGELSLAIPGEFNVENATLALAAVVGVSTREEPIDPLEAARQAARGLAEYRGSKRRFEPWGEVGDVAVVHDYAHHPTEVRVTLEAARRALPGRPLHVLFQPHQHSRTARFFGEFVESLRSADRVVIADVYGARAHIDGEHTAGAAELADALRAARVDALHGGHLSASVAQTVAGAPERCAILVLGAGDVEMVKHELLEQLALRRTLPRGSLR